MNRENFDREMMKMVEPNSNLPLMEIGLIRDIMLKEEKAAMTLIATEQEQEQGIIETRQQQIEQMLRSLGITDIHFRIKTVSAEEKQNIITRAQEMKRSASRPITKAAAQNPFPISPLVKQGVRFIAVASGKGGVGKSTVTLHLARSLQKAGKNVGIIDADIYGFSIPDMMGIYEKPEPTNNRPTPLKKDGIQVISTGFFVKDNNPVLWRGPRLGRMLSSFLNDVKWESLDYMLIDLPPGTGDIALAVHQMIPECLEIIVTTPQSTAAVVAERAGLMALQTNHRILGVVENMSYYEDDSGTKHYIFGKDGGKKLADQLRTSLLARIPIIPEDGESTKSTILSTIYDELAQHIIRSTSN
ncbi:Mrp/NBP35 family ATP-binding protein [Paenibacillus faecalis]|uniref:Mrp/NBP35 family ATP-binding protein n=1 Tax=Paenibacillus faecalis TaxID=2079532 RepID=UPI000D0FA1AF|nr:Mrp/NBP35 family ATP-binding protein [Paenibacillus faecalis]